MVCLQYCHSLCSQQTQMRQQGNIIKLTQNKYNMLRVSQTYRKLREIVDDTAVFQRYFGLIKLLEEKKQAAEEELELLKVKFKQVKHNVEQAKQMAKTMALLYRKIYGLSKQKIDVCQQFQDLIDQLRSQLNDLVDAQGEANGIRKKHQAKKDIDDHSDLNVAVYKSKLKQMKMARLIEKLEYKKEITCQNETTIDVDEPKTEKYDLRRTRKIRQL